MVSFAHLTFDPHLFDMTCFVVAGLGGRRLLHALISVLRRDLIAVPVRPLFIFIPTVGSKLKIPGLPAAFARIQRRRRLHRRRRWLGRETGPTGVTVASSAIYVGQQRAPTSPEPGHHARQSLVA